MKPLARARTSSTNCRVVTWRQGSVTAAFGARTSKATWSGEVRNRCMSSSVAFRWPEA